MCKFSRLQPSTHCFPRSPSVSSKDKAWPSCPQLISSGRERDKQRICTHIYTQPCFLTDMQWTFWQINGILRWAKLCTLHAYIYKYSMLSHYSGFVTKSLKNYIGNINSQAIHCGTVSELHYGCFYCLSVALQSFQPATMD